MRIARCVTSQSLSDPLSYLPYRASDDCAAYDKREVVTPRRPDSMAPIAWSLELSTTGLLKAGSTAAPLLARTGYNVTSLHCSRQLARHVVVCPCIHASRISSEPVPTFVFSRMRVNLSIPRLNGLIRR